MVDPLSIAAGIIAVLQLAETVIDEAVKCGDAWTHEFFLRIAHNQSTREISFA
jgi:hypothetical protein